MSCTRTITFLVFEVLNLHGGEDDCTDQCCPPVRCGIHCRLYTISRVAGDFEGAKVVNEKRQCYDEVPDQPIIITASQIVVDPRQVEQQSCFFPYSHHQIQSEDDGHRKQQKLPRLLLIDPPGWKWSPWFVDRVFFERVGHPLVRKIKYQDV